MRARVLILVFLLIVVVAAGVLLSSELMRIREVVVLGCEERNPAEVVNLAAIENEESVFKLKFKDITAQIDANPYFDVAQINYVFPDTLRIVVDERKTSATIEHLGSILVVDETGFVLETKPNLSGVRKVPEVTGLRITEGYQVCQTLVSAQPSQIDALSAVLTQLRAQNAIQLISSINLDAVSDIRMTTVSGFEVRLGNFEGMSSKIEWLRTVEPVLVSEGYTSGVITVSTGDHASFMETGAEALPLPVPGYPQADEEELPVEQPAQTDEPEAEE